MEKESFSSFSRFRLSTTHKMPILGIWSGNSRPLGIGATADRSYPRYFSTLAVPHARACSRPVFSTRSSRVTDRNRHRSSGRRPCHGCRGTRPCSGPENQCRRSALLMPCGMGRGYTAEGWGYHSASPMNPGMAVFVCAPPSRSLPSARVWWCLPFGAAGGLPETAMAIVPPVEYRDNECG